jgi:hypothetical protein
VAFALIHRPTKAAPAPPRISKMQSPVAARVPLPSQTQPQAPNVDHAVDSLKGGGQQLSESARAFFEPKFGADFSSVRIHADSRAAFLADSVQAKAFTTGKDIVFGMSQYSPDSGGGRRLLAHELAHVVQQSSGPAVLQRQPAQLPCGLAEKDLQARMNEPLPWGYQPGDNRPELAKKGNAMRLTADYREIMSHCLPASITPPQTELIMMAVWRAVGVSLKEIIDGVMANRPYPVTRTRSGAQQLEAWLNPQVLSGSQQMVKNPRHIVTRPDESTTTEAVNLPAPTGTVPQCGDVCTAAERKLTEDTFANPEQPVRSCCETTQCDKIREGLSKSVENVNLTLTRMRSRATLDSEMHKHFHRTDEAAYLDVQDGLERVLDDLDFSKHQWFCRQKHQADETCDGDIGGRAWQWRILLCFDRGNVPWDAVLHEVMHTSGLATGIHEVYRYDTQFYPPPDALHNADSYAGFVEEVSDPKWQEAQHQALDVRAETGTSLRGGAHPLLGLRFEWTPRGPGLRVVDFTVGASGFWTPSNGVLPGNAHFALAGEAGLRVRPRSTPLIFDLDVGALASIADSPRVDFTSRLSASLQVGGLDSSFLLGVDLKTIYEKAQVAPDQWILGVSIGGHWGRRSRRERLSKP